ncbi:thrombospondin type 1 domain protein, partial [Cooperia oncophora]
SPRIDVKWSSWSAWSDCSATCGEAVQKRQRYCENAKPYPDKGCEGNLYETRSCSLAECTDEMSKRTNLGNCTCGCEMVGPSGFFFATAADADLCDGNQTWSMAMLNRSVVSDFKISADIDAQGKLFFFVGAPYKELVWFSGSNQEQAFTLPVDRPIFVVLWYKGNSSALKNRRGFSVAYSTRGLFHLSYLFVNASLANILLIAVFLNQYNSSPHYRRRLATRCAEKRPIIGSLAVLFILIIGSLAVLFILIIFIPPVVCASMTQKLRRYSLHEPSLHVYKRASNLFSSREDCGVMARSGTTDCTQMSEEKGAGLAHRSVGVQLSVQSTPRYCKYIHSKKVS